ncbi:hypothetical protein SDC9_101164 [bioreactor metagenome]|uniref:Uncharacterized protein n=1 Tax=bioreactor metagenome TaxID=1076179 RepID=A0A645AN87_9ZZZZ
MQEGLALFLVVAFFADGSDRASFNAEAAALFCEPGAIFVDVAVFPRRRRQLGFYDYRAAAVGLAERCDEPVAESEGA